MNFQAPPAQGSVRSELLVAIKVIVFHVSHERVGNRFLFFAFRAAARFSRIWSRLVSLRIVSPFGSYR